MKTHEPRHTIAIVRIPAGRSARRLRAGIRRLKNADEAAQVRSASPLEADDRAHHDRHHDAAAHVGLPLVEAQQHSVARPEAGVGVVRGAAHSKSKAREGFT